MPLNAYASGVQRQLEQPVQEAAIAELGKEAAEDGKARALVCSWRGQQAPCELVRKPSRRRFSSFLAVAPARKVKRSLWFSDTLKPR